MYFAVKTKYPYQQAFSQRLRLFTNEERLSAVGLARKLNLPRSTVCKWLSGNSAPDRARLQAVCKTLGFDTRLFVGGDTFDASEFREKSLISTATRHYEAAVAKGDVSMISDALALAGSVVFVGLRRRGLPGCLRADEAGVVQVDLRDPDMVSLRVVLHHSVSSGTMCLQVKYSDDAPAHDAVFNFTDSGLSALARGLRTYAAEARRVFRPAA